MSASWTRHARSISTRQTSIIPPNGREAAVFADQAACAENLTGDIRIPDHPLVEETVDTGGRHFPRESNSGHRLQNGKRNDTIQRWLYW
jgi:hypothetical protein